MKIKYVVSACLAGCKCRYDGKDNLCPKVKALVDEGIAITVCPEVMGGLPTPRIPSERKDGKIINAIGEDNTKFFHAMATERYRRNSVALLHDADENEVNDHQ